MTVSKSYVDAEGRVMAVTMPMPVEPVKYPGGDFIFEAEYKASLQQVKDTSVRFEGHNNIKAIVDLIIKNGYSSNLKSDTFYDHDTVEVEIGVICCEWGGHVDSCANETCWDLTECQFNPVKFARILPIVEKPEQSEWISVTDRLPEDDSDVFVLVNGKFPVRMDHYCLAENDWPRAWYKTSNVTHWLPMTALPSPPKP
jgi:hypothetical protein